MPLPKTPRLYMTELSLRCLDCPLHRRTRRTRQLRGCIIRVYEISAKVHMHIMSNVQENTKYDLLTPVRSMMAVSDKSLILQNPSLDVHATFNVKKNKISPSILATWWSTNSPVAFIHMKHETSTFLTKQFTV